jgi:ribonuclease J
MSEFKHTLNSPVEIYALGGLGEVGKNLYCVENDNSLLIIDCGVMFPDSNLPGIDYIIPDFTHLRDNQNKIKALVITHGHEDHIGGIPFLLQQVNVPIIYAPKIAAALIRHKLSDDKIHTDTKIIEYDEDDVFQAGDFKMEFYHVTHSIPDSFGIYITTPQGTIVESGDFKIDLTPVDKDFDIPKLVHFGDRGIDLLMADSTNAEKEGYTPSERTVIQGIQDVFSEASGRLIISTFSSNICRIQQIIETSMKFKRKIIVFGRSMESNIEAAREFGYIKIPDNYLCAPEDLKRLPPEEVCILCTGTQGEPMAVLSRIARGDHRFIHVLPGDTIVFSSSVIPGNTGPINAVINQLTRLGASVITNSVLSNLHASGHASKQEMRLFQKLCRPHYFMPIHGEYRMLKLHADIGVQCGLTKDHTFVCENGDVLTLINHNVTRGGQVQADAIYIDGKSTVSVSTSVMKDRNTLINEGMVGVFLVIDPKTSRLVSVPLVESRGFISSNKKSLQKKASEIIGIEVDRLMKSGRKVTYSDIKSTVKAIASHFLYRESHRNPMVIPVILNYNEVSPSKKVQVNY